MCGICGDTAHKPNPLVKFIDKLVLDLTTPVDKGSPSWYTGVTDFSAHPAISVLDEASNTEFTREEYLAHLEAEYAGYDPSPRLVDDAGEREAREELFALGFSVEEADEIQPEAPEVTQHQRAQDKLDYAHLGRVWRGAYLNSPEGGRTVRGANPFSTDDGATEWLLRTRSELREEYRKAVTPREKAALVSRDAALRARHNARLWARAVAHYYGFDISETLAFIDTWRKENLIGWLGLEAMMRSMFAECEKHYLDAHLRWEKSYPRGAYSPESQGARDEWLDAKPEAPVYPVHTVNSTKRLRGYFSVKTERTRTITPFEAASSRQQSVAARQRARRAKVAEAMKGTALPKVTPREDAEWWSELQTWKRAEMVPDSEIYTKNEVPESVVQAAHGDLCPPSCWCQRR